MCHASPQPPWLRNPGTVAVVVWLRYLDGSRRFVLRLYSRMSSCDRLDGGRLLLYTSWSGESGICIACSPQMLVGADDGCCKCNPRLTSITMASGPPLSNTHGGGETVSDLNTPCLIIDLPTAKANAEVCRCALDAYPCVLQWNQPNEHIGRLIDTIWI